MADNEGENKRAESGEEAEELDLSLDKEIDTEDLLVAQTKEEKEAESKVAAEKAAKEAAAASPARENRSPIFALRTTANREEQVIDFITSNAKKKKLEVYSLVHPHGMRGYIFIEAKDRQDAEQAAFRVPYARGLLPKEVAYEEIEHMLEPAKKVEVNIQKGDIVEIISGAAFKHSQAKVTRIDKTKEEVVVELLESAVPIPITLKMDAVKVIRRESEEGEASQQEE
ncbi:transcription elongation factor Spt5 [Candidatus Woesearchaeota archaeon]|nr:transcription elongation factor Spt5 [Candidatus Woesearchaeota archaeon]